MPSQPGEESLVRWSNSFAELPARQGARNAEVGRQIGYRTIALGGLNTALGLGLWIAVANRDVAVAASGDGSP